MTDIRPRPNPPRPPGRPGPRSARPATPTPRRGGILGRGRGLDIGVLAAVVVAAIALSVFALTRGFGGVDVDTDARLPANPPAEWSAQGLWKSPELMPKSGRVLVVGTDHVAFLTADRKVLLVEAASGKTTWAANAPDGQVGTPLAATKIDGKDVIAAQFGDSLAWWGKDDGTAGSAPLPPNTKVSFDGTAPLARSGNGTTAVVTGSGPRTVTVPTEATAWAARADGVVVAASPRGWWHLTPGTPAGPAKPWQTPDGRNAARTVVGYASSTLVTTAGGAQPSVTAFADRADDVNFLFDGRYVPAQGGSWTAAPGHPWGILGRTLVDLQAGSVTDLGAWTTQLVDEDRALGTIGSQSVIAGPRIPRGVLQNREGFPEGITSAGAVVRAKTEHGEVVYLLPPAGAR